MYPHIVALGLEQLDTSMRTMYECTMYLCNTRPLA